MPRVGPQRPLNTAAALSAFFGVLAVILMPLLASYLAIRYADRAESEIRSRYPYVRGLALARIGRILGYLSVLMWIIVIIYLYRSRQR